jgi:hypothetical protein
MVLSPHIGRAVPEARQGEDPAVRHDVPVNGSRIGSLCSPSGMTAAGPSVTKEKGAASRHRRSMPMVRGKSQTLAIGGALSRRHPGQAAKPREPGPIELARPGSTLARHS